MTKKKTMLAIIILVAAETAAMLYDVLFNSRHVLAYQGTQGYVFRMADLPLIITTLLLAVCVVAGMVYSAVKDTPEKNAVKTRTVNPKLGLFGFCGFMGFLGIPLFIMQNQVWPFFFFSFFGFFGFYYEGKLSGTLIDERFKEERTRAQLNSYKIGFAIMWATAWFAGFMGSRLSSGFVAVLYSVSASLTIALVLFLSSYLLYKYDTEGEQ